MNEKIIRINFIVIFILLLIFVPLIARIKPLKQNSPFNIDSFWASKTFPDKKPNILFYGDSRTYRGINPDDVSAFFPGYRVHNMGYSSGGMNKKALNFCLSTIDTTEKQPIIVLGITPFSLSEEARKNKQLTQENTRPFYEIIERKYIYPMVSAFEPIDLNPMIFPGQEPHYYQYFNKNGWVSSYKIPEDTTEALPSYKKQYEHTIASEESVNETLLFVKNCTKRGISVYGFQPPVTKAMDLLEQQMSGFDVYDFKKRFVSSGGIWLDIPCRYGFHSYDGSHLDDISARKLSTVIGKMMKQTVNDVKTEE